METPVQPGTSTPMPKSLWAATTARPEPYPLLQGNRRADVCIIGGGFMGLAAATVLAKQGVDAVVLEAAEVGWGASGRNNGLVAPGLKRDPWQVRKLLGEEEANRLLRVSAEAPQVVFDLIAEHGIDCDVNMGGWIQAAHSKRALRVVERRVREWQALGVAAKMIADSNVADELGTGFYQGACRFADGASINPLAYAHGLAQVAAQSGAAIYEQSPVLAIQRHGDDWLLASGYGVVAAPAVLCCTNAYNSSIEMMHGMVLPLRTAQVASYPMPHDVAARILPGAAAASDTQRLLTSFRVTADNRLIMGGAYATAGDEHAGLMTRLHTAARERFPDAPVAWELGWSGYLALTRDHLPQIVRADDGFIAGIGCNGRGIAMATVMGGMLADLICGGDEQDCSVPVRRPALFPGFGLRNIGVGAGVRWKRLLDNVERRWMS